MNLIIKQEKQFQNFQLGHKYFFAPKFQNQVQSKKKFILKFLSKIF